MSISKRIFQLVGMVTVFVAFSTTDIFANSDIWTPAGTQYPGQINNITGAGGWWYSYSDFDNDGGSSTVSWGNGTGEFNDNIETAGMIDVDFVLGSGFTYPFAGIGFNWINDDDGGEGPYDISTKGGLEVSYSSTAKIVLELKWDGTTYGWATYQTTLPSTAGASSVASTSFNTYKRGYTDADHPDVALSVALTSTTGVQFKFAGSAGATANLKIGAVGWTGGVPVLSRVSGTSLNANLSGRSLAFTGLGKATLAVEVINLQGQIVARDALSATKSVLNLNKLGNGVYIIRAQGKDINFSHKVNLQ